MAYDIIDYGGMLADKGRTSSYDIALRAKVKPGAVVLDIGAGLGVMSFLAVRAGAGKVYAVEGNEVLEVGRQVAADNAIAGRIEFIRAMTTEIDLPEKVDGIVMDLRGRNPYYQKGLISILDARDRFLKPEGWIIPSADSIWAAPASAAEFHDKYIGVWGTEYGLDFRSAGLKAANIPGGVRLRAGDILAPPQRVAHLDYRRLNEINLDVAPRWVVARDAVAHGLCTWFDCEAMPGVGFSNSPLAGEHHVYQQLFFSWPEPVRLAAGDCVETRLRADFVDVDYVWSWRTKVLRSERVVAEFRQSTFIGVAHPADRMRKRGSAFVPDANDDCRIDARAIDLIQRRTRLDDIAKTLLAEFPESFKNWNAALARAADLSERYSK